MFFIFKLYFRLAKKSRMEESKREKEERLERRDEEIIYSHSFVFVDAFFTLQRTYCRGSSMIQSVGCARIGFMSLLEMHFF